MENGKGHIINFFIKREMDLQSNLIIPLFLIELSNFDKIVQNTKFSD